MCGEGKKELKHVINKYQTKLLYKNKNMTHYKNSTRQSSIIAHNHPNNISFYLIRCLGYGNITSNKVLYTVLILEIFDQIMYHYGSRKLSMSIQDRTQN